MINLIKISVSFLLLFSLAAHAAPSSDAWEIWQASNDSDDRSISHKAWQEVLNAYLSDNEPDGVNRFAYGGVSADDKKKLEAYLDALSKVDPRLFNRDQQFAYWVNLYNALTVNLVIDEYPVKSIRKIRFLTSPLGPWDKSLIKVAGIKLTLNDIEHRILRPIWNDPRIHFAVNCASIGCPNLQKQAFTADNSEDLLEQAADEFINHSRGIERQGEQLVLSSIFDWYGGDFGDNQEQMVGYFEDYLAPENQAKVQNYREIEFQYDWSLNEKQ